MSNWMQTYTGRPWYVDKPRRDDVDRRDIAHALSQLCRYGGHSRRFYSVAEHCIHVSRLVPPEDALAGLLHDATEAYVVDVPRPLKRMLADYHLFEAAAWDAIADHFGISRKLPDSVEHVDKAILWTERDQLFGPPLRPWMVAEWGMGAVRDPKVYAKLDMLGPEAAERAYIQRLEDLLP
jgi:hypothetical protein